MIFYNICSFSISANVRLKGLLGIGSYKILVEKKENCENVNKYPCGCDLFMRSNVLSS